MVPVRRIVWMAFRFSRPPRASMFFATTSSAVWQKPGAAARTTAAAAAIAPDLMGPPKKPAMTLPQRGGRPLRCINGPTRSRAQGDLHGLQAGAPRHLERSVAARARGSDRAARAQHARELGPPPDGGGMDVRPTARR